MMTIINLGYLVIIYFLMVLTESIGNGVLEFSITVLTIIVVYKIYFYFINLLINRIESRLIKKLEININKQIRPLTKYKKVNIITYIGRTYLMLFIVDDNNNLLSKVRMKDNLFQRYTILDLDNQRIGSVNRIGSNYYNRLLETRTNLFIQKFWGKITLSFNSIPVKIKVNDDYTKIEFHSAADWKDIIGKISFKGESRTLTTKVNLTDQYQLEIILFTIAYITRFYYPGNN